jgi:hypothetical protein
MSRPPARVMTSPDRKPACADRAGHADGRDDQAIPDPEAAARAAGTGTVDTLTYGGTNVPVAMS